jgi:hypothetical protein
VAGARQSPSPCSGAGVGSSAEAALGEETFSEEAWRRGVRRDWGRVCAFAGLGRAAGTRSAGGKEMLDGGAGACTRGRSGMDCESLVCPLDGLLNNTYLGHWMRFSQSAVLPAAGRCRWLT